MLLTKTYKNISDLEEEKVRRNKHLQLSISELHLLETVGKYSGTAALRSRSLPTIWDLRFPQSQSQSED